MINELILFDGSGFELYPHYSGKNMGISLHMGIDKRHTFEKQLKNRKGFEEYVEERTEFANENGTPLEEDELKTIEYIRNNFDNLLDCMGEVRLIFENIDSLDFIKKNPILLSKKIILRDEISILDYDKVVGLLDKYREVIDSIYVIMEGNSEPVSLVDCYKTINEIKSQADSIKSLNLSPIENIMYVYDKVRNRVYAFEDENESISKSRDLTEVLQGDKIVCLGYANIFNALLHYIGIPSDIVHLYNKTKPSGHARNVVYVKDPKYDIDGVYYFDPTWDSKRKNETNEYLLSYHFFARTKQSMDEEENYKYQDIRLQSYSKDLYEKIKKIIDAGEYDKLTEYYKTINYMSSIVIKKSIINLLNINPLYPLYGKFDTKDTLKKIKKVFDKFNKEIPAETMLRVWNNVRKIEYYQDPDHYTYTPESMFGVLVNSNWKFKERHLTKERILIEKVFGEKAEQKPIDTFRVYGNQSGMFKEIAGTRLAKSLKLIREKKENEDKNSQ